MRATRLKQTLPFIFLFLLLSLLGRELFSASNHELPSALVGEPLPRFALPYINAPNKMFTPRDLYGRVTLINVWASWCSACVMEHDMMMKIKNVYHVPVYGILYKDSASTALQWLNRNGNPYVAVGNDASGDVSIDFGIYGTPETYVISPQGRIVYRQVGVIDQETWDDILYPLIKTYGKKT